MPAGRHNRRRQHRGSAALSEAAVGYLRKNPAGKAYYERLVQKHGKGKALTVLAHKLARAVYHIWKHDQVFDQEKFLRT